MRGDKLVIEEGHRKAAHGLADLLLPMIRRVPGRFTLSISGESGSGKSEIASVLADRLVQQGVRSIILQQDDYFVYPPKTNAAMRRKDINHVGVSEVRLDALDRNLEEALDGKESIAKPLVIFEEDRIEEEILDLEGVKSVIVEGTYTTMLENIHQHVFLDRTYVETQEARKRRAREEQDEFLEKVLEIEHEIISANRSRANIIVSNQFEVMPDNGCTE